MQTLKIELDSVRAGNAELFRGFRVLVAATAGLRQIAFEHLGTTIPGGQNEVRAMAVGARRRACFSAIYSLSMDALLVGVKLLLMAVPAVRFANSLGLS